MACLVFSAVLTWYNYRGDAEHIGLLTGVLLVLLGALCATGIIQLPVRSNIPFFTVWPRLADYVKAAISFALIFLWSPVAMQLTPDTSVGVTIILAPDAILLLAALVFLSNGLSKSAK